MDALDHAILRLQFNANVPILKLNMLVRDFISEIELSWAICALCKLNSKHLESALASL
jgi:hypothetical protein